MEEEEDFQREQAVSTNSLVFFFTSPQFLVGKFKSAPRDECVHGQDGKACRLSH